MIEKRTIFDFLEKVFLTYGVSVVIFVVITYFTGADANEISTLFVLGAEGIALSTLTQLLAMSVIIVATRYLFFTDRVIQNMSILKRTIGMLGVIIVFMVIFIKLFGWFAWNRLDAWIGFVVSFGVCVLFSTVFAIIREKYENRKMSKALEKLKEDREN